MIRGDQIIKEFGDPPTRVLHGLDFEIGDGEFVAITGRSGSGKSTLLYLISTLDDPTGGAVTIDGKAVSSMGVKEVHAFRNRHIGFIFQFHYLLPELTALENVLLPARNLDLVRNYEEKARELLSRFDLEKKADRFPSQLSGGEQQRVAIARALIMQPKYIFADEPTGNLDSANGQNVMQILKEAKERDRTTIVLVTHEPDYAAMADREIYLVDGRISLRQHDG
jgi:ABC-type lipoprotein export system ATPase subunit